METDNEIREKSKEALKRGIFTAFIPCRLEIKGRPELEHFPFNVLFMRWKVNEEGKKVSGTALYEPEFHTYKKEGKISSMRYRNIYGNNSCLVIIYDEEEKQYHGEKFIKGESVGFADGKDDWNKFFIHLGILGIKEGEDCLLEVRD
jgi:hypothetical protein